MITQSTLVYDLNADTHFSLTAVSYWGTYITISGKKIMWKDGLNKVTAIFVIDVLSINLAIEVQKKSIKIEIRK